MLALADEDALQPVIADDKGVEAEAVRQKLLEAHGVGAIALGKTELRVAFSCLTEAQIPGVFSAAAQAIRALRG